MHGTPFARNLKIAHVPKEVRSTFLAKYPGSTKL
jgi:hypothetical protein